MNPRLLLISIGAETDIVLVRKRTRRLAELLGFERQDQTRITTAVSEIARNAFEYGGGGQVEFGLDTAHPPQSFVINVRDRGKGIADLPAILAGSHKSATGMGLGLLGRAAADGRIPCRQPAGRGDHRPPGQTAAALRRRSPPRRSGRSSTGWPPTGRPMRWPRESATRTSRSSSRWISSARARTNWRGSIAELQDTNRGVVALYAELDERADHLRRADELKSRSSRI